MTKYIKPPKRSQFLAFTFGYFVGFVSFVLTVLVLGYFIYFGLTVRQVESFASTTFIDDSSSLAFAKDVTLSNLVTAVKDAMNSEEGFSVATFENAIGEDVNINFNEFLPENIDIEKFSSIVNSYTNYSSIKSIPFKEIGTALGDIAKNVTFNDVIDVTDMFNLGLNTFYDQYKLNNFDNLIIYISENTEQELNSLKDVRVVEIPTLISDIIKYARIKDAMGITDGFLGEDFIYNKLTDIMLNYGINSSVEKTKNIVDSITKILGENASVVESVSHLGTLLETDLYTILAVKDSEIGQIQLLPITKFDSVADLNGILNKYFCEIPLVDFTLIDDTITFNAVLQEYIDNSQADVTLAVLSDSELKDYKVSELINCNNGLFALNEIKNSYIYLFNEEINVFDNINLNQLMQLNIVDIAETDELYPLINYTLKNLEENELASTKTLNDYLTVGTGLLDNPYILNSSIKTFISQGYLNIRISDLNNLGITFATGEGNQGGIIAELPKNTSIKNILNLDFNEIFKDKTIGDLLTSGGNTYSGAITALYDVKITDLLNKGLIESLSGKGITLGKLLDIDENATGVMFALKDVRVEALGEDIENIEIGQILGLTSDNEGNYTKENNSTVSPILLKIASSTISTIADDFTNMLDTIKIGEILGLDTDQTGNFVDDGNTSPVLLAISNYTINGLNEGLENDIKIGDLLGLEKENGEYIKGDNSNVIMAIANFTISGLKNNIDTLKIGDLLGLSKDQNNNFTGASSVILAISDYTLSGITNGAIESIEIGTLLGLNKDQSNNYTEALNPDVSPILLKLADYTLDNISSNMENIVNSLTLSEAMNMKYDNNSGTWIYADSGEEASKLFIELKDTTIDQLDNKINQTELGVILGLNKDINGDFTDIENPTASVFLLRIASSTITNVASNVDNIINNLKLCEIMEINDATSPVLLVKLKNSTMSSLNNDISNLKLTELTNNPMIELLKIYDEHGIETGEDVTIGNMGNAKIDIKNMTITNLKQYGLIGQNDLNDYDDGTTTLDNIIQILNSY